MKDKDGTKIFNRDSVLYKLQLDAELWRSYEIEKEGIENDYVNKLNELNNKNLTSSNLKQELDEVKEEKRRAELDLIKKYNEILENRENERKR